MLLTRRRIQENTGLLDQAYGDYEIDGDSDSADSGGRKDTPMQNA
ncbi:hypothetical protein J008_06104 [Cryptococcus neoformans]|nr:hypothetical protein J008_06104 [Cryptococcus neoformans var. grubii]